jgi:hypothetical protein
MKLDVFFDKSAAYNFERLDVAVGEKFKVVTDVADVRWFFDNDPVVAAIVANQEAIIEAKQEGTTTVMFVKNNQIIHQFTITVINPVNLNPVVLNTELK